MARKGKQVQGPSTGGEKTTTTNSAKIPSISHKTEKGSPEFPDLQSSSKGIPHRFLPSKTDNIK